jgi:hypothetical protein
MVRFGIGDASLKIGNKGMKLGQKVKVVQVGKSNKMKSSFLVVGLSEYVFKYWSADQLCSGKLFQ